MNICVVGASRGLGRSLCVLLTQQGHSVWGVARSAEELKHTEQACAKDRFQWSVADIADHVTLCEWMVHLEHASFVPDIVVLNAAVQLDDMETKYDHERGAQVLRVNLEGVLGCVSLFLPDFLAHHNGRFVVIASTAALRPSTYSASYAAAKAGIVMAFRSFRLRFQSSGVSFGTVMLGPIQTPMWEGHESWLVPTSEKTAASLLPFITSRRRTFYYPYISTTLLRLSLVLPDIFFAAASRFFLK